MLTAGGSQGKLVSERRRPGSARSAFQAAQAASTTASWPPASTRWLSQRSRRYSHTRSTGFNSGLYGGGWIRVRFAGTVRSSLTCQPAPSSTSAAWVPAGTARASSARNTPIAAVETSGRTSATPSPRSGQTAPNSLVSTGRRNTSLTGLQHRVESLGGRSPPERLARSAVEGGGHGREVLRAVPAQVGPLREVLPQEPVGVLVRAALPRGMRVTEVDLQTRLDPQPRVLRHLRPLVPGQRAPQLLRQARDRARDRIAHRLRAVPGQRRPVLLARCRAVARHRRQVEQYREPRRALDERADRGTPQPEDEVALPVARHRPVLRLRRPLADQDLGRDEGLAPSTGACPRHPQRPSGAQAGGQLAAQRAATLDVERLVDGLVADPHRLVAGRVEPRTPGDLLRPPGHAPAPVLPSPVPPPLPGHGRPGHRGPARSDDGAGEPVLHVRPQRRVRGQLRPLRPTRRPLGVPLRGGRPVLQGAAPRGRVAAQFPRDRRGRPPEPPGDLPHPVALRAPQRDLLAFRERQVPPRGRPRRPRQRRWWHAARLPEPADPHRRRHTYLNRRVLAGPPRRDRRPEPPPVLTPRHPWPARRARHAPPRPIRTPPPRAHREPSRRGVATTA